MPKGYIQIPDWFSVDNQGGGVAVADVAGTGKPDLLVVTVDNPGGQNRGVYRLGRRLDAQGNVTAGWTPWIDIPDWFSWENQGVGAAVVDLDKDGHQDLVVFMIDNPPGQNQGYYRVGKQLNADGQCHHDQIVAERLPENIVGGKRLPVGEADKRAHRRNAVPVVETELHREQHRPDDERREKHKCGQQEQRCGRGRRL